jgi:hypothetical protein
VLADGIIEVIRELLFIVFVCKLMFSLPVMMQALSVKFSGEVRPRLKA